MSYKEYEGLSVEAAIAKVRAKSFHDEEDLAFVRARAEYFSPEEFEAITSEKQPAPEVAPEETPAAPEEVKAPENGESQTSPEASTTPEAPVAPEVEEVNPDKHKLDELQAMAAEANLDTSGTKAEIAERINESRKAAASQATA